MKNAFRIFRRDMKRLLRSPAAVLVMMAYVLSPLCMPGSILQPILTHTATPPALK